jgi:hypothetical protein
MSDDTNSNVAIWNGGQAQAVEVERRLHEVPHRRDATDGMDADARIEALVERYRIASRALVVDSILLERMSDRNAALAELGLTDRYASMHRDALLQAYLQELADGIEIGDDEVEAYYAANPERFSIPGKVVLWNIYRRHEDPDDPAATTALLHSVRERFLAGETFSALAREYSQSETRLREGLVGEYKEGELPPKLAEIVFALGEHEVSEPVPVKDGAVLLHVSEKTAASSRSLSVAQPRIEGWLRRRALNDEVAERVRDLTPPEGSMVLSSTELEEALEGADSEQEILAIGEFRATALDFALFAKTVPWPNTFDPNDPPDETARKLRVHSYRRFVEQALLYGELVRADDRALAPELRDGIEEQLVEARDRMIADEEIRRRVEKLADTDEGQLRTFYNDNLHHFQTALRLRVRRISVPIDEDDPTGQMATLEDIRERLVDGELTLQAAAAEIGGAVTDLGWQESRDLSANAHTYVLELGGVGFAIPYVHEEQELHLLHVEEREDPRVLEFAQARERVAEEYLRRNRQVLAEQVIEQALAGAQYSFNPAVVRRHLAPPPS